MRFLVRTLVGGSAFVALMSAATPAAAQNLDFGYQWQHLSVEDFGQSYPLGFGAAYEYPLTAPWSVVGFVDVSRRSESEEEGDFETEFTETIATFGGAARWTRDMMGAFSNLFVQAGFGVARSSFSETLELDDEELEDFSDSETSPLFTVGAGVVRPINDTWSLFVEADYRRVFEEDAGANVFRIFVGARLPLGN